MDPYSAKVAQHIEAALRELEAIRSLPPAAELHGLSGLNAKLSERIAELKKAVKSA